MNFKVISQIDEEVVVANRGALVRGIRHLRGEKKNTTRHGWTGAQFVLRARW